MLLFCHIIVNLHMFLEKNGFYKVGILKNKMFRYGRFYDMFIYELLKSQWMKDNKN